jgi:1,4-dihydroxy-2-naphthoyl-CoA hydrolase
MNSEHKAAALGRLNASSRNTLMELLEIVYSDLGEDFLEATMPVLPRVHQPMGLLHGGATAALAESVGSAASAMRVDLKTQSVVGMELSINHLRSVREGVVTARATAVHLGRTTHLRDIRVQDGAGRLVAVSRLSMMVLERAGS